jgi:hypothetical protein
MTILLGRTKDIMIRIFVSKRESIWPEFLFFYSVEFLRQNSIFGIELIDGIRIFILLILSHSLILSEYAGIFIE